MKLAMRVWVRTLPNPISLTPRMSGGSLDDALVEPSKVILELVSKSSPSLSASVRVEEGDYCSCLLESLYCASCWGYCVEG